jgi:hypothetical protein
VFKGAATQASRSRNVLARSLDDGQRFRIDLRLTKNGPVVWGSVECSERMNQRAAHGSDCGDASCDENLFDRGILLAHLPDNCRR